VIGALLLLAQAPAAAASTVPLLSVTEVMNHPGNYDGQRVRMTGWLLGCNRERCVINLRRDPYSDRISIERSAFDRQARRVAPRRVTIEGRVNERCFRTLFIEDDKGGSILKGLCGGNRPPQLTEVEIVDLNPPPDSEGS